MRSTTFNRDYNRGKYIVCFWVDMFLFGVQEFKTARMARKAQRAWRLSA